MAVDPTLLAIETEAIAAILDELDYFQVLKVPYEATAAEIRAAFHTESRLYHPDRWFHLEDQALKARIHRIYKRITEAWSVLRDEGSRVRYLADVTGPERASRLRYTEEREWEHKKARDEEVGTTPQGRKFYQAALVDLAAGRTDVALRNLKAALMYEPANALYRQKAEEAQRHLGSAG